MYVWGGADENGDDDDGDDAKDDDYGYALLFSVFRRWLKTVTISFYINYKILPWGRYYGAVFDCKCAVHVIGTLHWGNAIRMRTKAACRTHIGIVGISDRTIGWSNKWFY